ncbi:MAG TPA: ribonuclease P protein component 1 [Candidatus Altiarchaeales archaeon]|nr:ribonuclease P protein component 1 [Candidatus Altiarchaeales archaeon]
MITPLNILRHELIGLKARVVKATHQGYKQEGIIIGETKNTIKIRTKRGEKVLPKNCIVLELELPDGSIVRVDGKLLISRPEDRIKKRYRIKFV